MVDFHLVDFIYEFDNTISKVFAPEHGFRGTADAGEVIKDGVDLKLESLLYHCMGKTKNHLKEQLKDIDIMIFDIQDVGARFYTYISTLHYVMEACAENNIQLVVLDRPNPNGHYIDGPILEAPAHKFCWDASCTGCSWYDHWRIRSNDKWPRLVKKQSNV